MAMILTGCAGRGGELPAGRVAATEVTNPVPNRILITDKGFEPASLAIPKGTTVIWVNTDRADHWVASDPYPIHTDLVGFTAPAPLKTDSEFTFRFDRPGRWAYHDHLRPVSYTGTIIVTE